MNKKKVLHIVECAGGVDMYLSMLLPKLKQRGIRQDMICSLQYKSKLYLGCVDWFTQLDIKQSFDFVYILRIIFLIRSYIKKNKYDIIYCHSTFAGCYGRLASLGLNCKVIYNPHGWCFNIKSGAIRKWFYIFVERILYFVTDVVICISEAEVTTAKRKLKVSKKLKLVINGIDIAEVEKAQPILKSELSIPENHFVVGMVGRLCEQKAPDVFLDMAELLLKEVPKCTFIMVGDGSMKNYLYREARRRGLPLIITGWIDHPYKYMKLFDVGVLLSRWEGFGLVVAEYMAAKINIVATRVDAIPTLLTDGVDSFLVDVDSSSQAKEYVKRILTDKDLSRIMVDNAYKKVKSKYDIERVVEQHMQIFCSL